MFPSRSSRNRHPASFPRLVRRVALTVVALAAPLLLPQDAARAQRRGNPPPAAAPTEDYDIVFFGPQGAVFLRLKIDAGRNGVTVIRRSYASGLFRALDADGDGKLSAAEAAQVPSNGQRSAGADVLGEGWTALDMSPQDGAVSDEELFLFVDQQLGARFRIEAARPRLQQTVQLSSQLDTDGDGLISREEIEQGLAVLQSFDFDDDETLSVAELQPFPTAMLQAQRLEQANAPSQLPVALIATPEQRAQVLDRLLSRYAPAAEDRDGTGGMPYDCIGMPADAAKQADSDQDGRLSREELASLLESPSPSMTLTVNLVNGGTAPVKGTRPGPHTKLKPRSAEAPLKTNLELAGMDVGLGAMNTRYEGDDLVSLYLIKFIEFDTDKNQYLNEGEFASIGLANATFAMVDANGDGMVMRAELKQYLEVSAALAQAALVLTVSDDAKTLFEILDTDLDNRLNVRDFRKGAAEMNKFDHDQDERLATSDLRSKYGFTVTLARPEQFQDPGTMMRPQARQPRIRTMTAGPTWFRKMDRNQDGDLTWREFLGTRADFDRIDADGNGLIDLNEAVGASAASAAESASQ